MSVVAIVAFVIVALLVGAAINAATILCSLVRLYQRVAPARIRSACRFTPSCSNYSLGAIEAHGAPRGIVMTISRLRRCKPPNGGVDPP